MQREHQLYQADFLMRSYGFQAGELLPAGGLLGWSPSTVFSGQTLKAGHFWHPATTAMGHSVMAGLLLDWCRSIRPRDAGIIEG